MEIEELKRRVGEIRWFHTIDLGHGVVTPGLDASPQKLTTLGIPEDLTGKSVMDFCSWNGFFAFEAERRGASPVVAVDYFCWAGEGWGTKAGFDLAHEALGSKVQTRQIDVLDVTPANAGVYDVVMLLGVLYHMRHPLLALEVAAAVTGDLLILETHVDLTMVQRPAMAFYPNSELNGDPSNWCGPNEACVIGMLLAAGFKSAHVHSRTYDNTVAPELAAFEIPYNYRAVFHARK